jgi:hypothetical protein
MPRKSNGPTTMQTRRGIHLMLIPFLLAASAVTSGAGVAPHEVEGSSTEVVSTELGQAAFTTLPLYAVRVYTGQSPTDSGFRYRLTLAQAVKFDAARRYSQNAAYARLECWRNTTKSYCQMYPVTLGTIVGTSYRKPPTAYPKVVAWSGTAEVFGPWSGRYCGVYQQAKLGIGKKEDGTFDNTIKIKFDVYGGEALRTGTSYSNRVRLC